MSRTEVKMVPTASLNAIRIFNIRDWHNTDTPAPQKLDEYFRPKYVAEGVKGRLGFVLIATVDPWQVDETIRWVRHSGRIDYQAQKSKLLVANSTIIIVET